MSWKTTLFAVIAAAGLGIAGMDPASAPAWVLGLGKLLSVVGMAATGFFARDHNVTSEQAGAK